MNGGLPEFINHKGNAHDVWCSLDCNFRLYSIADIEASITDEKANRNRSAHIKHLTQALGRKKAGCVTFRKGGKP